MDGHFSEDADGRWEDAQPNFEDAGKKLSRDGTRQSLPRITRITVIHRYTEDTIFFHDHPVTVPSPTF